MNRVELDKSFWKLTLLFFVLILLSSTAQASPSVSECIDGKVQACRDHCDKLSNIGVFYSPDTQEDCYEDMGCNDPESFREACYKEHRASKEEEEDKKDDNVICEILRGTGNVCCFLTIGLAWFCIDSIDNGWLDDSVIPPYPGRIF